MKGKIIRQSIISLIMEPLARNHNNNHYDKQEKVFVLFLLVDEPCGERNAVVESKSSIRIDEHNYHYDNHDGDSRWWWLMTDDC